MHFAAPILFALFTWWISTGIILWLINRPKTTRAVIGAASTGAMLAACVGVFLLRPEESVLAAYLGFSLGILSWAWHELMFLMGFVSGPRKTPLPEDLKVGARFRVSAETVIHHEVGIAIHAALLALLSIGAENTMALSTFLALWGMRMTAKLLIFFGAPNIAEHFLPHHLRYLGTYFRKASNPTAAVCALTVTGSAALILGFMASSAPPGAFHQTGLVLLTTLVGLAVFEHLALVVRVPDSALWSWALRPAYDAPKHRVFSRSTDQ